MMLLWHRYLTFQTLTNIAPRQLVSIPTRQNEWYENLQSEREASCEYETVHISHL